MSRKTKKTKTPAPAPTLDIQEVTWVGLDLRKVWQVFPKAERAAYLDAAFAESAGSPIFTVKDAYDRTVYAKVDDQGNLMSLGAQLLLPSTVDALMAAGAVLR